MSTSKSSTPDGLPSPPESLENLDVDPANVLADATGMVTPAVRATTFYLGAALPLVYLPLLVAGGASAHATVAALMVAHAISLVVGHEHDPGT